MSKNSINPHNNDVSLTSLVSSKSFINLDPEIQNKLIDAVHNNKETDGGHMGKFLGNKPTNVSMHIGLIICVLLFVILMVDTIVSYFRGESINLELVNIIVPVLTLSLGYIFGKGNNG